MKTGALALALALALTAACVGPTLIVQQYAGPVQPKESIAILRVNGRDSVQLLALDGADVAVPIAEDSRLHVEMLPIAHTVVASDRRDPYHLASSVGFRGEPGHVYRLVGATSEDGTQRVRVWEVDRESDAPIRDVTIDRRAPIEPAVESVDAGSAASSLGEGGTSDASDSE